MILENGKEVGNEMKRRIMVDYGVCGLLSVRRAIV